jgi:hypothetical protein
VINFAVQSVLLFVDLIGSVHVVDAYTYILYTYICGLFSKDDKVCQVMSIVSHAHDLRQTIESYIRISADHP